jgi:hypothetical protein
VVKVVRTLSVSAAVEEGITRNLDARGTFVSIVAPSLGRQEAISDSTTVFRPDEVRNPDGKTFAFDQIQQSHVGERLNDEDRFGG